MTVNPAPQISMLNRIGVFSEVGVWFFCPLDPTCEMKFEHWNLGGGWALFSGGFDFMVHLRYPIARLPGLKKIDI